MTIDMIVSLLMMSLLIGICVITLGILIWYLKR